MVLYRAGARLFTRKKLESIILTALLVVAVAALAMIVIDLRNFDNYVYRVMVESLGHVSVMGAFNQSDLDYIRSLSDVREARGYYYWLGNTYREVRVDNETYRVRVPVNLVQYSVALEEHSGILLKEGRWPRGEDEAVLYRSVFQSPGSENRYPGIGDHVYVETSTINGTPVHMNLTIVGVAVGTAGFGDVSSITLFLPDEVMRNITGGYYTWIAIYGYRDSDEDIERLANETLTGLKERGSNVFFYFVNKPSQNPIRGILESVGKTFTIFMYSAIAIIAVLSAASGVALIEKNTRIIGVLKAVGVDSRQVFVVYTIPWLLRGVLGTLIGLAISPYVAKAALYAFLQGASEIIDYLIAKYGFAADPMDLAYAGGISIATMLIASIVPGLVASRINVRDALQFTGLRPRRVLGFAGGLKTRIALRNLVSHPWKLIGLMLSIAILWGSLMQLSVGISGVWGLYESFEKEYRPDMFLYIGLTSYTAPTTAYDAYRVVLENPDVLYAEAYHVHSVFSAFGLSRFVVFYALVNGSWRLPPAPVTEGRYPDNPGEAAIGRSLAYVLGVGIGDTITYRDEEGNEWRLRVVGIIGLNLEDGFMLYVNNRTMAEIMGVEPGRLGAYRLTLTVKARSGVDPEKLGWRLRLEVEKLPFIRASFRTKQEMLDSIRSSINTLGQILFMLLSVSIYTGIVAIAAILIIDFAGKLREIGVLRALGFTNGELTLISLIEAIAATLLALPVAYVLGAVTARIVLDQAVMAIGYIEAHPRISDLINPLSLQVIAVAYIIAFLTNYLYLRRQATAELLRVE